MHVATIDAILEEQAVTVPRLSICIPTYNRAELLDNCLASLLPLVGGDTRYEVVVSDNASTDDTARIVEKHRHSIPRLVYSYQPTKCEPYYGIVNAIRNATGTCAMFLADDDSLLFEPLNMYVERIEQDPSLVAIFADWVAYDDERKEEMHRYFRFRKPVSFGPHDPLGLVNFIIGNIVFNDMGIFRRTAVLRSDCIGKRIHYAAHRWAYRLSRLGRVAYELEPFYREHRVVKPGLRRGMPDNMRVRLQVLGDEMRGELETILLWALQDSGLTALPDDQMSTARLMIDHYLNSRISLEVQRAIGERNWLMALDLRRRQVLWSGQGSPEERERDALALSLPAALQAVRDAYFTLAGVGGLLLEGFSGTWVTDFFRSTYPEVRIVSVAAECQGGRALVLAKHAPRCEAELVDGYRYSLEVLLQQYSVGTDAIDVTAL